MTLLVLGLALWWATHLFPLVAKPRRDRLAASMGEQPYKGVFTLVTLGAVALMVLGYQAADWTDVWTPPEWARHLNNLLMLVAVGLFGASHSTGNAKRYIRHPMLWGVVVWAAAHLLVKGHLAAVVLFGGLGLWAIVAMFATNARDGVWTKPEPAPRRKDLLLVGITVAAYVVIGLIHGLIGPSPFPG